jgi:hypothetical protein
LHYDGGEKTYEMQQRIQPGDQILVNFAELIQNRVPDRKGQILPADLTDGTYEVKDLNSRPGTLTIGGLALDKTYGYQTKPPSPDCCGFGSPLIDPSAVGVSVGGVETLGVDAFDQCTNQEVSIFTTVGGWWSGSAAIATVTAGKVTGVSPGYTTANGSGDILECFGNTEYMEPFDVSAPVTVISFQVIGKSYIFVGTDPNELWGNHYVASNGSGEGPQPAGGTCRGDSSDQSDTISLTSGTTFQVTTLDQSTTVGDRTLTFEYDLSDGEGASQQMNVTAREFAYATNTSPSNTCSQYGYSYTYVYTPYTHPDDTAILPSDGISGTGVTETVTPQTGGTVCTNYQETGGGSINNNAQFQDFVSLCSNSPLPACDKKYTQALSVAGYPVRTNTLEFKNTGLTYTSQGPNQ